MYTFNCSPGYGVRILYATISNNNFNNNIDTISYIVEEINIKLEEFRNWISGQICSCETLFISMPSHIGDKVSYQEREGAVD